jgi:glutamate dehydrogenase/leucine dehydrogenase
MQSHPEDYDVVVLGSGEAGKYIAWTLARKGMRAVVIERKYVGGSCPSNVNTAVSFDTKDCRSELARIRQNAGLFSSPTLCAITACSVDCSVCCSTPAQPQPCTSSHRCPVTDAAPTTIFLIHAVIDGMVAQGFG